MLNRLLFDNHGRLHARLWKILGSRLILGLLLDNYLLLRVGHWHLAGTRCNGLLIVRLLILCLLGNWLFKGHSLGLAFAANSSHLDT